MTDDTTPAPASSTDPAMVPDGWEFYPSRWAALWLDGTAYRLKPPKVGELKKLSELVQQQTDEMQTLTQGFMARLDALRSDVEAGRVDPGEVKVADLEMGREQAQRMKDGYWSVLCEAFAMLGDRPLPADDDLPGWVYESAASQVTQLLHHFRTAPPPRGVRP